jgi:hypothetical protein
MLVDQVVHAFWVYGKVRELISVGCLHSWLLFIQREVGGRLPVGRLKHILSYTREWMYG